MSNKPAIDEWAILRDSDEGLTLVRVLPSAREAAALREWLQRRGEVDVLLLLPRDEAERLLMAEQPHASERPRNGG